MVFNRPDVETSNSPLVQLVERRTVNPYVASSSLARGATFEKAKSKDLAFFSFEQRLTRPSLRIRSTRNIDEPIKRATFLLL